MVLGIYPEPSSQSSAVLTCMEIVPARKPLIGFALEQVKGLLLAGADIIPCRKSVRIIIRLLDNIALQGRYAKVIEEGFSPFCTFVRQVNIEISRLFRHYFLV